MDGAPELLVPILETVMLGGLWDELAKFPPDVLQKLAPRLSLPRNLQRLLEIYVEEKSRPAA